MKKGIWLSLLTFLLVGTVGFSVLATVTPQYEADFTITDGKGKVTSSGKTYVDGLKIR